MLQLASHKMPESPTKAAKFAYKFAKLTKRGLFCCFVEIVCGRARSLIARMFFFLQTGLMFATAVERAGSRWKTRTRRIIASTYEWSIVSRRPLLSSCPGQWTPLVDRGEDVGALLVANQINSQHLLDGKNHPVTERDEIELPRGLSQSRENCSLAEAQKNEKVMRGIGSEGRRF